MSPTPKNFYQNFGCPDDNADNQNRRDQSLGEVSHDLSALPSSLSKIWRRIVLISAMSAL
jgi:hypothetical protein